MVARASAEAEAAAMALDAESAGPPWASLFSKSVASAASAASASVSAVDEEDSSSGELSRDEGELVDSADSELLQFPHHVASSSVRRARMYDVRSCCGVMDLY